MTLSYQAWILDSAYTKIAYLESWLSLAYRQQLNGVGTATIQLRSNDAKIALADITTSAGVDRIRRLRIVRNGVIVFGGLIETASWDIPPSAPADEKWQIRAGDHGLYLNWRLIIPDAGQEVYAVTDSADDVVKNLVRYHAGASAAAARRFSDLTVAADAGAAPSYAAQERYTILLNAVNKIAERDHVYWRMVPTATGCTFTTGYPLFGLDATRNNGVNDECIFTLDRRNWLALKWQKDRSAHANYIYVGGQGEGVLREIVERSDATAIAALYRREQFVDARQMSATASLQARGDAALQEYAVKEDMTAQPISTTWKATTGTHWDLGYKVTIDLVTHRQFTTAAIVTGIDVTVAQNGTEVVTPTLEPA